MLDYNKIGKRIQEERKYILKRSQERMAEDLNMYQADISNLEKAKRGSGITDLSRLDLIADYLGISLRSLIFGDDTDIPTYAAEQMTLRFVPTKVKQEHTAILERLMEESLNHVSIQQAECGPYTIYSANEIIQLNPWENDHYVPKLHTYIFYQSDVVGVMSAYITTIMQHVFRPHFVELSLIIEPEAFDVNLTMDVLNPYWSLYMMENYDESSQPNLLNQTTQRMNALRRLGENRCIVYIDGIYVREAARRKGIMRMYMDLLRLYNDQSMIWLNLLPTSGRFDQPGIYRTFYSAAEIGQVNINAAIAEKFGFTIDTYTEWISAKILTEDGNEQIQDIRSRKIAYYLPGDVRNLLKDDTDLIDSLRALRQLNDANESAEMAMHAGTVDDWQVAEFQSEMEAGRNGSSTVYCYAAWKESEEESKRFVVSRVSAFAGGVLQEDVIECYTSLEEAADSEYYDIFHMLTLHHHGI